MASTGPDWGRISAIFGIVASLGGVAGFFFSPDTQRCVGIGGPFRGHPLRALKHCADDRIAAHANSAGDASPVASTGTAARTQSDDPRQLAATRWVFYDGDAKTYVTFNADGTVTFSDPTYGAGGTWSLAGTRGVAFHTDAYDFGGTIGRGLPDSFEVIYSHIPRGSAPEAKHTTTFTRVGS